MFSIHTYPAVSNHGISAQTRFNRDIIKLRRLFRAVISQHACCLLFSRYACIYYQLFLDSRWIKRAASCKVLYNSTASHKMNVKLKWMFWIGVVPADRYKVLPTPGYLDTVLQSTKHWYIHANNPDAACWSAKGDLSFLL